MKTLTSCLLLLCLGLGLLSALPAQAFYAAEFGRWINRDPNTESSDLNLHTFCLNKPLLRLDPYGHNSVPCSNPCEEFKQTKLAENPGWYSGGAVICCGGQHYACPFGADGIENPLARALMQDCQKKHEESHFDQIDCPQCEYTPNRPDWRDKREEAVSECHAYSISVACIKEAFAKCLGDKDCEKIVGEWLADKEREMIKNCKN